MLAIRERVGSLSKPVSAAPPNSQQKWMRTIMTASTAVLSKPSHWREDCTSVDPVNTAAIANQAFGLAIASRNPDANEGARSLPSRFDSVGAVAIFQAR